MDSGPRLTSDACCGWIDLASCPSYVDIIINDDDEKLISLPSNPLLGPQRRARLCLSFWLSCFFRIPLDIDYNASASICIRLLDRVLLQQLQVPLDRNYYTTCFVDRTEQSASSERSDTILDSIRIPTGRNLISGDPDKTVSTTSQLIRRDSVCHQILARTLWYTLPTLSESIHHLARHSAFQHP